MQHAAGSTMMQQQAVGRISTSALLTLAQPALQAQLLAGCCSTTPSRRLAAAAAAAAAVLTPGPCNLQHIALAAGCCRLPTCPSMLYGKSVLHTTTSSSAIQQCNTAGSRQQQCNTAGS